MLASTRDSYEFPSFTFDNQALSLATMTRRSTTPTNAITTRWGRPYLLPSVTSLLLLLLLLVTMAQTCSAFFLGLTGKTSRGQAAVAPPPPARVLSPSIGSETVSSVPFFYPWRGCAGATATLPLTTTYVAAAAASGGNDEEEDGHPDESDAPKSSTSVESWRNNGQEPPPPPAKHPTQLDLTGLPAKVMGSVFKLKVISCPPLFRRPWSRQPTSTSFSTAWAYDVEEKLLLTNSHCVMDAVVINVKKPGNSNLFKAEVLGKSDHSDLALLRVPDEVFWEGVEAIRMEPEDVKLGELVTVIGYPRGGEKICLTKGIVSRLHFNGEYLSIQIDAVSARLGREAERAGGREGWTDDAFVEYENCDKEGKKAMLTTALPPPPSLPPSSSLTGNQSREQRRAGLERKGGLRRYCLPEEGGPRIG